MYILTILYILDIYFSHQNRAKITVVIKSSTIAKNTLWEA